MGVERGWDPKKDN